MTQMRVAIYGSGRTAGELVKELRHSRHELVAAIVHSAHRAGQDLGTLTIGEPVGLTATADMDAALSSRTFDVLLYAGLTGERQAEVMAACAEAGVDMVHACFVHPRIALDEALYRSLADRAATSGSRIVGTGMIPGRWLDVLPSLLSSGAARSGLGAGPAPVGHLVLGKRRAASGTRHRLDADGNVGPGDGLLHHRPVKRACLFSRKWVMPSRKSSVERLLSISSSAMRVASSSVRYWSE